MAAVIENIDAMRVTAPRVLSDSRVIPYNPFFRRSYDIAPDGRFIAPETTSSPPRGETVVVMNALAAKKD